MENIPAKPRQLLDLVAYQGLKYREAAGLLGIPLGTVKSRMNKALQSLRKGLSSSEIPSMQRDCCPANARQDAARSSRLSPGLRAATV